MTPLEFRIDATAPATHHLGVTLELDVRPGTTTCELFLPTWTPGSYLVREYSRHLSRVEAEDAGTGEALICRKSAKNRYAVAVGPGTKRVRVRYRVYAHELTVRTSDVTAAHAYWNNACVLLWPVGEAERACELHVAMATDWDATTPMRELARKAGMVHWRAENLDEAIDSPCLLGRFTRASFEALGVQHDVVFDGLDGVTIPTTLLPDLRAVVEAAAAVFGGALPYRAYTFLCLFADEGYGGLEHVSCCTLLMSRTALTSGKSYREFVSLCAHELFHAWNQKRMRPAELWEFDYEAENYTSMLWLGEGWTAYYDDLLCRRAGVLTAEQYVDVIASNLDRVRGAPGRFALSLAESSYDAWIRLYRPDENTRNSSQNYYVNGAVAAMCLDLELRRHTAGERGLDDVIRSLYQASFAAGRGYRRDDVEQAIRTVGGEAAVAFLRSLVDGPLDPDPAPLLAHFGITCKPKVDEKPYLGVAFTAGSTKIASVTAGSPAARAGLSPGDECIAMQGLRTTNDSWADVLRSVARVGEPVRVLLARRGVMQTLEVVPEAAPGTLTLSLDAAPAAEVQHRREAWLGKDPTPQSRA